MTSVVFAANKAHANAMIGWLRLDDEIWHGNLYGGKLLNHYDRAILVRPVDGVTEEHFQWITLMLAPRMTSTAAITPLHWRYDEFPDEGYDPCSRSYAELFAY